MVKRLNFSILKKRLLLSQSNLKRKNDREISYLNSDKISLTDVAIADAL